MFTDGTPLSTTDQTIHIDLHARFDERKVAWTKTNTNIGTTEFLQQLFGRYQKISKSIRFIRLRLKRRFRYPLFTRLSTRLLFTLTLLSALPLIIVGLFMTSVTKRSIEEYIHTQHNEIASHAGNEIILFLRTPIAALNILLETQDIKDMDTYSQSLILNRVKSSNPMFNRIFTLDTLGTEFASSAFEKQLIDYKTQKFFKKAISGESDFSQVNFNEKQEPYVISSHPIREFGEIVGVLAGEIDLKSIWDLLDGIKIGQSGNAFFNQLAELIQICSGTQIW